MTAKQCTNANSYKTEMFPNLSMSNCTLCPRKCGVNRLSGQTGYCGQTIGIRAARAALHFWEEPCISGTTGSGTVFFTGCNLRCVFCQNHEIAKGKIGKAISHHRLAEIFLELQEKGAANINLVTPGHFIPQLIQALSSAKAQGLTLPIVYNTGSYEEVDTLKFLEGIIDIYLPDLKYCSDKLASDYANAPDYFEKATAAIAEMLRQVGRPGFDSATGLMKKGVIVRHLVLPGQVKDSKKILRYLWETHGNDIYVSIMNQYTPLPHVATRPELNRRVTTDEYRRVLRFAEKLGIEQGFIQEGDTASDSFIPQFNTEGI